MKRKGKVFIDANMINYAVAYQDSNVFEWINKLYEEIYIHQAVLDELLINRVKVQGYVDNETWLLFDPDNEDCVSEEEFSIYEKYEDDIKNAFQRLKEKKIKLGRNVKQTSDLGEISSLAAAIFLSATIMCSNDYDIREVITDEQLSVSIDEESDLQLIIQDTVEDFCFLCVAYDIAKKKEVKKFFKFVNTHEDPVKRKTQEEIVKRQKKVDALNERLKELSDD